MKWWFYFLISVQVLDATCQIRLEGEAQGTTYHIQYRDALNRNLQNEVDSLLYFFDLGVSTYHPESDITRINLNLTVVPTSPYFIQCFNSAKTVWKNTQGAFDPTVYPLVNAWGFGPESFKQQKPDSHQIDSILHFVGFSKISLVHDTIFKLDPRVKLDFNAFAQGYSVDVVSDFLESRSITEYLVEIGGEVYAQGPKWFIGIETPSYNKTALNPVQSTINIDGKGVATSGNYRKYIEYEGVKYAHHINPTTGYPAKNRLLSATVISDETILSDATATGLLVMGLNRAKRYLKRHHEIDALLIYSKKSGKLKQYYSKHWNYTVQ